MGKARQRVAGDGQWYGLCPRGIRTVGCHHLRKSGCNGVGDTLGEVHRFSVGRKGAGSLVEV